MHLGGEGDSSGSRRAGAGAVLLAATCLARTGCRPPGGNPVLDAIHTEGANCGQCHVGFTAAGTVYTDPAGTTPLGGAEVRAVHFDPSYPGGTSVVVLGVTDDHGNFHTEETLTGGFLMWAGNVTSGAGVLASGLPEIHYFPGPDPKRGVERKSCNLCHVPGGVAELGSTGRIYGVPIR